MGGYLVLFFGVGDVTPLHPTSFQRNDFSTCSTQSPNDLRRAHARARVRTTPPGRPYTARPSRERPGYIREVSTAGVYRRGSARLTQCMYARRAAWLISANGVGMPVQNPTKPLYNGRRVKKKRITSCLCKPYLRATPNNYVGGTSGKIKVEGG